MARLLKKLEAERQKLEAERDQLKRQLTAARERVAELEKRIDEAFSSGRRPSGLAAGTVPTVNPNPGGFAQYLREGQNGRVSDPPPTHWGWYDGIPGPKPPPARVDVIESMIQQAANLFERNAQASEVRYVSSPVTVVLKEESKPKDRFELLDLD